MAKSKLAELNDKLEESYIEMEQLGATLSNKVIISEAKNRAKTCNTLTKTFQFLDPMAVALEAQKKYFPD